MSIKGLEGMTNDDLADELANGARFVIYSFTISVILMTFKQPTSIYLVRSNENAVLKSLPWVMLTLVFGWWGFPWGPIYSIWSLVENLGGGKDVTREVCGALNAMQPQVIDAELIAEQA